MRAFMTRVLASALLLGAVHDVMADVDEEAFHEAEAVFGYHYLYADEADVLYRVGEFVDLEREGNAQPYFDTSIYGGTESMLYRLLSRFEDTSTHSFLAEVHHDANWRATSEFSSFQHNLDDDQLKNLAGREINTVTGTGGGGKQVFHTDADPNGVYGITYSRFQNSLEYDLPWMPKATAYVRYDEQRRHGMKQVMHVAHCSFCHVEANGREVNDQRKTWRTGVELQGNGVALNYEFKATHFADRSGGASRYLTNAQHPTRGENRDGSPPYGAVFDGRLNYEDQSLDFAIARGSERRSHQVGARVDLPKNGLLRGGYTRTDRKNTNTNIEASYDAFVASWLARPSRTTRFVARGVYTTTKVDDVYVDVSPLVLPNGNPASFNGYDYSDFDWTRISSANRDVLQADANFGWRYRDGGYVKAAYRYRTIDRESMAQSQVDYERVGEGAEAVVNRIEADPFANKTTENRFSVLARQRFGRKASARVKVTYQLNDDPYYNPEGICEESLSGRGYEEGEEGTIDPSITGDGAVYYFQRVRFGNAGERPTDALRYQAQASWQLASRASLMGYANYAQEENDDLNVYDFERTVLGAGGSLWAAPTDALMLSVGYAFNSIESNAKLCMPLFDG